MAARTGAERYFEGQLKDEEYKAAYVELAIKPRRLAQAAFLIAG